MSDDPSHEGYGMMARERREQAATQLLIEARDLFRLYESHHRAKIAEEGREDKMLRNKGMADAIDKFLREASR